jgi:hypothetical protein
MDTTAWQKQTPDKPLFPDLLWSRPENKRTAGRLLVIGGNSYAFRAPSAAYAAAEKAGIGTTRVILPDSTQKVLGRNFAAAEFAPSTPSGSFSRSALAQALEAAEWADGVLLAGDFGRNSETAIFLESFAQKYQGRLTVADDGLDYFINPRSPILERPETLLIIELGRLQKLAKTNRPSSPVLHNMSLIDLVTLLSDWTSSSPAAFITKHLGQLIVAVSGKVSTTPYQQGNEWQVELAASTSVWWLQQSERPLEALTSAIYSYTGDNK